jgi:hypothetical protein
VHLCAHNSAQCGLENPLRTNDSTHVQMISPLGTHNPAQSESQHGSHFVQVIGPTSAQSELILQFSLCESYWSHGHTILHKVSSCSSHFVKVVGPIHGYTILHKVDSCSPHFVQVVRPMKSQHFTKWIQNFKFLLVIIIHHLITLISINK